MMVINPTVTSMREINPGAQKGTTGQGSTQPEVTAPREGN
jgi:hypothetical protein